MGRSDSAGSGKDKSGLGAVFYNNINVIEMISQRMQRSGEFHGPKTN